MKEKASLECLDCHNPHGWTIQNENAKGLCDKCHPLKDPVTFIYIPTGSPVKP
jgi:hypothetical protein